MVITPFSSCFSWPFKLNLDFFDGLGNVAQAAGALGILSFAVAAALLDALLDFIRNVRFALFLKTAAQIAPLMLKAVAHINVVTHIFDGHRQSGLTFFYDPALRIAVNNLTGRVKTKSGIIAQFLPQRAGHVVIQSQGGYLSSSITANRAGAKDCRYLAAGSVCFG